MFEYINSLLFYAAWFGATFMIIIICIPSLFFPKLLPGVVKIWAKTSLCILRLFHNIDVDYIEDQAIASHGQVIACKHQSVLEILVLAEKIPNVIFLYKASLNWVPLINVYLWRLGYISVYRSKHNTGVIDIAMNKLPRHNVVIFPEGTRTEYKQATVYKKGVAVIYQKICEENLPYQILPTNTNSGKYWARKSILKQPGTAIVHVGKPFYTHYTSLTDINAEIKACVDFAICD